MAPKVASNGFVTIEVEGTFTRETTQTTYFVRSAHHILASRLSIDVATRLNA
jgi:hypothetical protein